MLTPNTMNQASGLQTLTLTGLRFDANLGILAHEKNAPQPIQVDAELSLGAQPLAPADTADLGDLADPEAPKRAARWAAVEALRAKFGEAAVLRGRGLKR